MAPPEKFVEDQCFCVGSQLLFGIGAIVLGILSVYADDGGEFPIPFFFTGFVLGAINLLCVIAKRCVVSEVQRKGVTKDQIVNELRTNWFGKTLWPLATKFGILWCVGGSIITGISGVNCYITENDDYNATSYNETEMDIANTCYYDIEGDQATKFKIFAIVLIVLHVISFVYFIASCEPEKNAAEHISDPTAVTRPQAVSASANQVAPTAPVIAPPSKPSEPKQTETNVKNDAHAIRIKALDQRAKDLAEMKRRLDERERQLALQDVIIIRRQGDDNSEYDVPPPPTYHPSQPPTYGEAVQAQQSSYF